MKNKRLEVGREVKTVETLHAHVTLGMVGRIEQVLPDGYGVYYADTFHISLFGGNKHTKPAIVYMREKDVVYTEDKK